MKKGKMPGYFLAKVTNTQYSREIERRPGPLSTELSTGSVDKEMPESELEFAPA
jgi:hypothetical protein